MHLQKSASLGDNKCLITHLMHLCIFKWWNIPWFTNPNERDGFIFYGVPDRSLFLCSYVWAESSVSWRGQLYEWYDSFSFLMGFYWFIFYPVWCPCGRVWLNSLPKLIAETRGNLIPVPSSLCFCSSLIVKKRDWVRSALSLYSVGWPPSVSFLHMPTMWFPSWLLLIIKKNKKQNNNLFCQPLTWCVSLSLWPLEPGHNTCYTKHFSV